MGQLRVNVLGTPEVFHNGRRLVFALRKAEALLLYLAVEGGLHPRSKLAALLWPDSEPADARRSLRNALTLLRGLLENSPDEPSHLFSEQELLGLNLQAPLELDLHVVQQAWKAAQSFPAIPPEPQRLALVAQLQHALSLVRGPFLDGFWLGEETGFDEWRQQQQLQVRVPMLFERLSVWQEVGGELELAKITLTRWLALDPLSEEASRRLMRLHLAQGDASAALQVYATLRTRLADELHLKPSAQTEALAERIQASLARPGRSIPGPSGPPWELQAPLIGRAATFRQIVERFELAQAGQPQVVLLLGEAGIGKTRLAHEFVAWARAQGAEVLSAHAFELGGRLPYQPLVEALRGRLEEGNELKDLLEDPWLAELTRLLPELRLRYPDLPPPTEDELSGKLQLFESVARLLQAQAQRAPLLLLLDDLHWADSASLDLLRYLRHSWKEHRTPVLLLTTVRQEEVEFTPQLAAELADLGRDLPLSQLPLPPLNQTETLELLATLTAEEESSLASSSSDGASSAMQSPLLALGHVLFARMGGQPLYLLETLKLLHERQLLLPRQTADGTWRLCPTGELVATLARPESREELVPPSVRTMIQTRLARLSAAARQLVRACAVLGHPVSAPLLWQVAELGVQQGVDALEEAESLGILREEPAGPGRGSSYRFVNELIRDAVYTELGAVRRFVLHQRALALLQSEGARASELAHHALATGEAEDAFRYSVQAGNEAMALFAVQDAIAYYEQAHALLNMNRPLQSMLARSEVEHLYVSLGSAYTHQNAWHKARQTYEELLAYAQEQELPALVSMTLNRLAILAAQQGKGRSEAQALLEQAWRQAQTSSDQRTLAETAWNQAQITGLLGEEPERALVHGEQALQLARTTGNQELQARSLFLLGWLHLYRGDFQQTIHLLEAALELYAAPNNEASAEWELSLPSLLIGAPLTQPLSNRASEALCWALLGLAQLQNGQVQQSIASGRRALALSREIKNAWTQVLSMDCLTYGLLEVGTYEEALELMRQAVALARPLPLLAHSFLIALGSTYHTLQQWQEARAALEEAETIAEKLGLKRFRVSALSRLCMHYAVAGEWEMASRYARKAISLRKSVDMALIAWWDFCWHYETEALLSGRGA